MLYGLLDLLFHAVQEFRRLDPYFPLWLGAAVVLAALAASLFWLAGRLVRSDWQPGWGLGSLAGLAVPVSFLAFLLLPAAPYLKPAAVAILKEWQTAFLGDAAWNRESFRRQYWAVQALKAPDGKPLEDFSGYPPPEQGGNRIPASLRESQDAIANLDSSRVAEHFQDSQPLLAKLLWTEERPLPEVLRADMEKFFRDNSGAAYPHGKAVGLAGTEMQRLLEEKIERIVLTTRIALSALLALLWLPLYGWASYDAWKKLEPITGKP
jgi:hypothetical protein